MASHCNPVPYLEGGDDSLGPSWLFRSDKHVLGSVRLPREIKQNAMEESILTLASKCACTLAKHE